MKAVEARATSALTTWAGDYAAVLKPRITAMVVVATLVGFYLGHHGSDLWSSAGLMLATTLGVAMVVGGANAANQLLERVDDARMVRTADRPLAAGRLPVRRVWWFALCVSLAGVISLLTCTNLVCAALAVAAWLLYVLAYTPLKRRAPWSVLVGAVPGALPPVIGWAAATGALDSRAFVLFAIVFVWQLPHFLSIAWVYRDDYARAGIPVLPVVEPTGKRMVAEIIAYSLLLIPVSLLPTFFHLAGFVYYVGAMVLGFAFLAFGLEVARLRTRASARQHMLASLFYLACLFTLISLDKLVS